jgi:hypothetical protein
LGQRRSKTKICREEGAGSSLLANGMVGPGEGRSFPDAFIGR